MILTSLEIPPKLNDMHIIAGKYKNRILSAPKGYQTRPTSARLRESLFNICQATIVGASFLDLFAGSGAIGLEALSRGASKAIFIESSKECGRCIAKNVETLKVQADAMIICGDVFFFMPKLSQRGFQFDIIYADPPYQKKGIFDGKQVTFSQQLLFMLDVLPLLKPDGFFFLEDAFPSQQLPQAVESLQLISSRRVGATYLCEYKKSGKTHGLI